MANRILRQYNDYLRFVSALHKFYSKSYISQNSQVFMKLDPNQYTSFNEIDGFFEIDGYELFGSGDANSSLLKKISEKYVGLAISRLLPISFHIANYDGRFHLVFGAPKYGIESLSDFLAGNIPSLISHPVISIQDAIPGLNILQTYSGTIAGINSNLKPDLDMVLNTLQEVNFVFSVISYPCQQLELNNEIDAVNNFLDIYQMLSQRAILQGATRRDLHCDDHEVLDLINLLNTKKDCLVRAKADGLWKTYVSIGAFDATSYAKVFSAFSSMLISENTTETSKLSLITFPSKPIGTNNWTLPNDFWGPYNFGGLFSNSFVNLLPSDSVAAILTLPSREHRGISINQFGTSRESEFGAFSKYAPKIAENRKFILGTVTENKGESLNISIPSLRQHTFITGFTQSGKSTTTFRLLSEVSKFNIPFIVVESAKKQYCSLLGQESFPRSLNVYSGGYDTKILYINPFEPEIGTILDNHIQSLVALISSLFDEQAPVPQILNLLVYKAYKKMGWSPKDRVNYRDHRRFPTISTMIDLIDEVIDEIGYSVKYSETADNMKGVIRGRLSSIIQGSLNDVLNSGKNISVGQMFDSSSVVELDDFSDANKSFISGLLALKVYEYSRLQDYGTDTRRLLVIEEAHNIVPNVDSGQTSANVALCSQHFTSMLAEVAAYGTGLIVIDQRPTAVSPAIIANTGTKIVHNLQAGEDKEAIAFSLGLTSTEKDIISFLQTGQAIVKTPNSAAICRVDVLSSIQSNVEVNWADLFLNAAERNSRVYSADPLEISLLTGNLSIRTIYQCISFAEMRLNHLLSLPEKMKYAGKLLNTLNISVRAKRQLLYQLYEDLEAISDVS